MKTPLRFLEGTLFVSGCALLTAAANFGNSIISPEVVFEEVGGMVSVEAEHFSQQIRTEKRSWHITRNGQIPEIGPDGDPPHITNASGGAYLELLPDSRRTHSDLLVPGENFSNSPGQSAVLSYKIHFNNPGRYFVWVRAYSTSTEDNGLHVGLDGQWPSTGQRMQWCDGKNEWRWESKQRTETEHCGIPYSIYLDVPTAGIHEILFSMREDGFEFDQFLLTTNRNLSRPEGFGPAAKLRSGPVPE